MQLFLNWGGLFTTLVTFQINPDRSLMPAPRLSDVMSYDALTTRHPANWNLFPPWDHRRSAPPDWRLVNCEDDKDCGHLNFYTPRKTSNNIKHAIRRKGVWGREGTKNGALKTGFRPFQRTYALKLQRRFLSRSVISNCCTFVVITW